MRPKLSALVGPLAAVQSLPIAPDLDAVEADLADALDRFAQLEFRDDGRRIDLIVAPAGPDTVDRWSALLQGRGVDAAALAMPMALARFARGRGIGLKLPVAGSLDSGELYIRGALPLAEAAAFLRRHGCAVAVAGTLGRVGAALNRDHVYMLAADVIAEPRFSAIFTQLMEDGDGVLAGLVDAAEIVGVGVAGRTAMRRLHDALGARGPRTLFCSVACSPAGVSPLIKLDYSDVMVESVVEAAGGDADLSTLRRWGMALGVRRADQVGLVYDANGGFGLRAYFGVRRG